LKDKKEIEEKEKILQEKYNIDFEKRKECIESKEQSKNMYLVEIKKERWYQRIIKKIFEFFKTNK